MKYPFLFGLLILSCFQFHAPSARAESGYQVIQGTRVFTEIDHGRGVATFSNSCGSQTLTQRELQQGAIPSRIIPCNKGSGGGKTCRSGYELTRDGIHCIPKDSEDCGNGRYCDGGQICLKDGCLNAMSSRVCADLETYCNPGYECRAGNKCVSPEAEKAKSYFDMGGQYYEKEKYEDAISAFESAAAAYRSANLPANAKLADGSASIIRERIDRIERKNKEEQAAAPSAAPTPQQQRPHSSPPRQVTQRDEKCSDVSGTGGPPLACPSSSSRFGFSCGAGANCAAQTKWAAYEPYNHGKTPVTFHQFQGTAIVIKEGESLWSIPDEASPTGRRLEARPWDKVSIFPLMQHKCNQERTTAAIKPFVVRIECEIERQEDLQREFEHREDSYPYIGYDECKSPKTLKLNPDWEKKSLEYWKANPEMPVGWCFIPARDNREDVRKVREPNWLPPGQCKSTHPIELSVSKRGVLGCPASSL